MRPYLESKRPDHVSTPACLDLWEKTRNNANTVVADWKVTDTEELKYILAQRNADYSDQQSINGTPLASITVLPGTPYAFPWGMGAIYNRITQYEQTSNELQWLGSHDTFHYVVGLYDFKDRGKTNDPQNFSMFGQGPLQVQYATNTDAQAIYGQADWEFIDRWTGTMGIRYTEETRSGYTHQWATNGYKGAFYSDVPALCAPRGVACLPKTNYSADFTGTTPMAALAFKFSDDLNFFLRAARGFKSGGFSQELINPAVVNPYKPEYSWAYELGAKSTLWDGRATLNATVFYTQLTDLQTTILIEGTTQSILKNAGKGERKGFELEGRVRLADGWTAYLNYGYLDASFNEYLDNKLNPPDKGSVIDTGSNRVPGYAPENTLSVGFDGRLLQTRNGALRLLVDYSYMDKYYLYASNKSLESQKAGGSFWVGTDGVPASDQINARLLWSDLPLGSGKVDLSLFVKNVTDSDKMVQGIDFSMFRTANWQDPRTYMFTANYKW
jgi:iron complex outermembrane receptor protein